MLFLVYLFMSPETLSEKPTVPEALLLLEGWLLENKTTRSSEVVRGVLLSLAGEGVLTLRTFGCWMPLVENG